MTPIIAKAAKIKLLILDVDGVLTEGKIYLTEAGQEHKVFYVKDGIGIQLLIKSGVEIAVITSRKSMAINYRLQPLGIKYIYQNQKDKLFAFNELKNKFNLNDEQIAFLGDDLPDLPTIMKAGLGIAVADAVEYVKKHADWITTAKGGQGAVREVCELIMKAQNKLLPMLQDFLYHE